MLPCSSPASSSARGSGGGRHRRPRGGRLRRRGQGPLRRGAALVGRALCGADRGHDGPALPPDRDADARPARPSSTTCGRGLPPPPDLDLGFFDRRPTGALVTRVTTDIESLSEMFTSTDHRAALRQPEGARRPRDAVRDRRPPRADHDADHADPDRRLPRVPRRGAPRTARSARASRASTAISRRC